MAGGRPIGSRTKYLNELLDHEKKIEQKIIDTTNTILDAMNVAVDISSDDISLDSAMKDCLYTIRYGAKRLKAMCVLGRGLSRDDVMNLKDLSSLIKSLKDQEKEVLETLDDEQLLTIAHSKVEEVKVDT